MPGNSAVARWRLEQTDHCGLASIILGRWSPGGLCGQTPDYRRWPARPLLGESLNGLQIT
jgi:hypothetical protein